MSEIRKPVYFNSERDADVIKVVQSMPNFSGWVKSQLRRMIAQPTQHSAQATLTVRLEEE